MSWISTSNPLYVVSAALFLFGLRVSFGDPERDVDSWALAGGLAFYTMLLAAAAVLLVRFAGIWNDVRTVLLLVVLLFLATSVTFDELLVMNPSRGRLLNAVGLAFAMLLSEGILRAIGLKLPFGFRLPYHLMLALFFIYPMVLSSLARDPTSEVLKWSLFAFPSVAGAVFLLLIPAIRRGPDLLRNNGGPWPWPFYPWSLFAFLAVAVVGRSFLICKSFHLLTDASITATIFAPFFLVPFGFALSMLVLEIGLEGKRRGAMAVALVAPLALVIVAGIGHREDATCRTFIDLFMERTGETPLFLTLVLATAFHVYAWLRGAPFATEALTASLAGFAFMQAHTLALADLDLLQPAWLAMPVIFQGLLGLYRREAWRLIAFAGVGAAWLTGAIWRLYLILRAEVAGLDYLLLGVLLLPLAVAVSVAKGGGIRQAGRLR